MCIIGRATGLEGRKAVRGGENSVSELDVRLVEKFVLGFGAGGVLLHGGGCGMVTMARPLSLDGWGRNIQRIV